MNIFITGISSGIGKELAALLVGKGYTVWGVARNLQKLKKLRGDLNTDDLHISLCDVSKEEDMQKVMEDMKLKNFIPDVVVLNAATLHMEKRGAFDVDLYRESFDTNLFGSIFWVNEFLDTFVKRNHGHFIAISSVSSFRRGPGSASYAASKAALSLTFRRLRTHFLKTNIKFSVIYFGPVNTDFWQAWKAYKVPYIVPSAARAAKFVLKIFDKKGGEYSFPFFIVVLVRLLIFVPERVLNTIDSTFSSKS